MKVRLWSVIALGLLGCSPALAASGRPSEAALAAMGLADLHVISDSDGLAIRGLGYSGGTSANGISWAAVSTKKGSAGSVNSYSASGKKAAAGASGSYAGVEIKSRGGHGGGCYSGCGGGAPKSISITAFSGGSSGGFRK